MRPYPFLFLFLLGLSACGPAPDFSPATPSDERFRWKLQGPVQSLSLATYHFEPDDSHAVLPDSEFVMFDSAGVPLVRQNFREGKLHVADSTEVDEWNRKTKQVTWRRFGRQFELFSQTEYRYRANGKLDERREINSEGEVLSQRLFLYDNQGRNHEIRINTYAQKPGQSDVQTVNRFSFEDSSLTRRESTQHIDGVLVKRQYFDAGRKIREENYAPDTPGQMIGWKEYEYDSLNEFIKTRVFDAQGDLRQRSMSLYDSEGMEVEIFKENGRGDPMLRVSKDYNDANDLTYYSIRVFDANYEDGKQIKMDSTPDITRSQFRYDAQGNWIWKRSDGPDEGEYEIVRRYIKYFAD